MPTLIPPISHPHARTEAIPTGAVRRVNLQLDCGLLSLHPPPPPDRPSPHLRPPRDP